MKTRKALTKRFKITKTGKVLRKSGGQNHYRAKKTGKQIRQTRNWIALSPSIIKRIKKSGLKVK
ncbi:MAG: 50S ribosomal protein L35 [Candidatus Pacebacteria bacterium]|nr:50S ribosomal protein L35 [Candidatus Paceibacterota bacterium]